MLRIKKPQPRFLSGMLRSKLSRRERWVEHGELLRIDILFAEDEDAWDKLTVPQDKISWTQEIWDATQTLKQNIREADVKNRELAGAMWDVVLRERELAAEEEKQRSAEK